MSNSIAKSNFSAPVVQSRLEHHHNQQQKSKPPKPEARQQHQRSKSLSKGKRFYQKEISTATAASNNSSAFTILPRPQTYNKSSNNNRGGSFEKDLDQESSLISHDSSSSITNGSSNNVMDYSGEELGNCSRNGRHQMRKPSSTGNIKSGPNRPQRRHQYSDSVDELRSIVPITILKRPKSATDFVNPSAVHRHSLAPPREEGPESDRQRRRSSTKSENRQTASKERRRSDVPSKAKRAQRRKEVKSMNEVIQIVKADMSAQDSSDESDVNSLINSSTKHVSSPSGKDAHLSSSGSPPLSNNNASFAQLSVDKIDGDEILVSSVDDVDSNRPLDSLFKRPLGKDFKRHSDFYAPSSAMAIPSTMPRRQSSTAIELQGQVAPFADANEERMSPIHNGAAQPSSSPSRMMTSKLYAGPTFHNSPAPSDLPLPSFLERVLGKEQSLESPLPIVCEIQTPNRVPTPVSTKGHRLDEENMFVMDDVENSFSFDNQYVKQQQSLELLTILAKNVMPTRKQPSISPLAAYNVPERMVTSRPLNVYPAAIGGVSLSEISENLRSLLKIQGQ